jgi:ATP-dependent DNA helicase RecG
MDADRILNEDPNLDFPQHRVLKDTLATKSANFVDFATL